MSKGTIRRLMDRGYGFIKEEQGEDLFFHRSNTEGVEFENLREGQEVEFEKGRGRDGRPAAVRVRLVEVEVQEELLPTEDTTEASEEVEKDLSEETSEVIETVEEDSTDVS